MKKSPVDVIELNPVVIGERFREEVRRQNEGG